MNAIPMDTDWQRITRDARAVALADLARDENTPLAFGQHIAWSECQFGLTNGFSEIHRVGFPQHRNNYTTCGERIPPPMRWLPLSPAMVRTMGNCKFCEAEMMRLAHEEAA